METKVKVILEKICNRLKAECIWAKMGIYTQFVYNRRKPLIVFKPTNLGGASIGILWCGSSRIQQLGSRGVSDTVFEEVL